MEDKGLMLWGEGLELLWLELKTELGVNKTIFCRPALH